MNDEGWASIPNWLVRDPKVTAQAKLLYVYLNSRTGRKNTCWPSLDKIAAETGMSKSAVQRALKELRSLGVIEWHHETTPTGWRSVYRISQHEGGCGQGDQTPVVSVTTEEDTVEEDSSPPTPPQGGESEIQSTESRTRQPRMTVAQREAFEEWYGTYPRKVGKGEARRAYAGALRKTDGVCILAGLTAQLPHLRGKEQRFIPHPATWLNGERWNDELTPRQAVRPAAGSPEWYEWREQQPGEMYDQWQLRLNGGSWD